ncbi:MAG TPA: hypothetical protein VIL34_18785 [Actinopolymorphaceae bacterium]|mgnify:CR=1 FL=1|jgi:hypothetical protein
MDTDWANALLWVLQIWIGLGAVVIGLAAATYPRRATQLRYTYRTGRPLPRGPSRWERLAGAVTAICGVALILPGVLDTATLATPVAALVLAVGATIVRIRGYLRRPTLQDQIRDILQQPGVTGIVRFTPTRVGPSFPVFLLAVVGALVIAWGRLGPYPL